MGFPFQINPASPIDSDSASSGDDELRALKQMFVDLFGIPATTNITAAIMDVAADGTITTPGLVRLGTITDQKAILDGSATWNDATEAFTAILVSITDTASDAASKLLDFKVGGSSKFSVDKAGVVTVGDLKFANNWVLTELDDEILFINPKGEKVLILGEDGTFRRAS